MIPLDRNQYDSQSKTEGVMERTVSGIINFWNRAAEELYGWKKEDAIGRVSHELLQTEFPESLKEIEAELLERGRWQGKLVHTTRDGDRVMVESRWILNNAYDDRFVVEINAPCTEPKKRDKVRFKSARSKPRPRDNTVWVLAYIGLLALAVAWSLHLVLGHKLIEDVYHGRTAIPFLERFMEGRGSTRIENYHQAADGLMLFGTVWLVASYLAARRATMVDPIVVLRAN